MWKNITHLKQIQLLFPLVFLPLRNLLPFFLGHLKKFFKFGVFQVHLKRNKMNLESTAVSHNVNWLKFRNRKLFQPFLVENVVRVVSRYLSSNEIYTRPVVKCQKITAAVAHCFRPSSKLVENVDRFNQPKIGFLQGNSMTKIQMKPFSSSFLWCRLLCCKRCF